MKKLIGTHDSVTGEKPYGLLSALVIPFSRTQRKTIKEQFEAGCRYFDIRVRNSWYRGWICAHGLFTTKKYADEIFEELNELANDAQELVYVNITYEGWGDDGYIQFVDSLDYIFQNVKICTVNIKYTEGIKMKWKCIKVINHAPYPYVDKYVKLDFRDWRTYIPLPWLYKKIHYKNVEFNDREFTFVDFL